MAQKYVLYAFAVDGDKAAIPATNPVDGSVSYDIGFGIKYQQDPATTGLDIPRDQFNQLMFDITSNIQILQQHGLPNFITSGDNGGSAFPYDKGSIVRFGSTNYESLVDGNTDTPPTANWQEVIFNSQSFFPGDAVETYSSTLPSGWLWMDGKTIGSATSGATSRANADTVNLFTVLWNSITNTVLPIQNSDGTAGVRGISAAADFAAEKRLPVPDRRGRVAAAADNLGGTAANRLNNFAQGGVDGTLLGNAGGEANHALSSNENATHSHGGSSLSVSGNAYVKTSINNEGVNYQVAPQNIVSNIPPGTKSNGVQINQSFNPGIGTVGYVNAATYGPQAPFNIDGSGLVISGGVNNSGLSSPHNTVQPTIIANFRIKL